VLEITICLKKIFLRNSQTLISVKTFPYTLKEQYSIILFTTTLHWSPSWATRTQFTSSQQKRTSEQKCNWRRKQL